MATEADVTNLAAALYHLVHCGRDLRSGDYIIRSKRETSRYPRPSEADYALAYSGEPLEGDNALSLAWPNILRLMRVSLGQWRLAWNKATAALRAMPKELVDDTDRPAVERWSAKLSRLLIEVGDGPPTGDELLNLPNNWSEQIDRIAICADELLAILQAGAAAQPATPAADDEPAQASGKADGPPTGYVLVSELLDKVDGSYNRAKSLIESANVPTWKPSDKARRKYVDSAAFIQAAKQQNKPPTDKQIEAFQENAESRKAAIPIKPNRKLRQLPQK